MLTGRQLCRPNSTVDAMLKLTRKNLLPWLSLLGYQAGRGIGESPEPQREPWSFKARDEAAESAASKARKERRRAK